MGRYRPRMEDLLVTTPWSLTATSRALSGLVLTEFSEMLLSICAERPTIEVLRIVSIAGWR